MGRRVFLTGAVSALAVPSWGEVLAERAVPAWLDAKIDAARTRYTAWKGADETVVFTVTTDLHDWKPDFAEGDAPAKFHKAHVPYAIHAGDRFAADFAADLGDIGSDHVVDASGMRDASCEEMKRRWQSHFDLYDKAKRPVFCCVGNHDLCYVKDGKRATVEPKEFGAFFSPLAHGAAVVWGEGRDYGYWDVPGKKCRIVVMDTMEWRHSYGFKRGQLAFLAKALAVPEGYAVLAMMHAPLPKAFGCWLGKGGVMGFRDSYNGIYADMGIREGLRMFEDFVAHGKGACNGVAWDFTGLKGNRLAGLLYGHAHYDNFFEQFNVRHICRQGHGWINLKTELPHENGAAYRAFSRGKDTCVDVVAIKPKTGALGIFRIGAGDEKADLVFGSAKKEVRG